MRVRFLGVRGSVPWSTDQSVRTGGNTPCIEVSDDRGSCQLILDAGTGLVGLDEQHRAVTSPLTILLSHYHWDHVQGLPFFAPFFRRGAATRVVGPALPDAGPRWLEALFRRPYFPLTLSDLASPPATTFVEPSVFDAGGFEVAALRLTHPGGSMAYRITGDSAADRRDLVYATDHEFGDADVDAALARFASGAAAIVMDAHYTPEELPTMRGRGHGSWAQCVELALASGVDHLWLFHHKPGRTDGDVSDIEAAARVKFPATTAAREGVAFTI